MQFTIFYDGLCPLCMAEMRQLMRRNDANKLAFEDINAPEFVQKYPDLSKQTLNARIHGRWDDGRMLTGLDVTYTAWSLVGKGWLYAPLRWPLIRYVADHCYLLFARHRYKISYWLTGQSRCENGYCGSQSGNVPK
ncbi:thiol-disulfide oxidoreductase DCC family protein [Alteromonas facilis]|uniref:thiol-disulfide oxidoreductase DCC family protein n=1 Tax=Alteromonas facilis TaxID=2048004 RepID=UPI000C28EB91|nr:DUF393 domain-containing protein [Alteromonas facilis]